MINQNKMKFASYFFYEFFFLSKSGMYVNTHIISFPINWFVRFPFMNYTIMTIDNYVSDCISLTHYKVQMSLKFYLQHVTVFSVK